MSDKLSIIVKVGLSLPVYTEFYYQIESTNVNLDSIKSRRVNVPFGTKQKIGVVLDLVDESKIQLKKIKPISDVLDNEALFSDHLYSFLHWVSSYYIQPLGEVVFLAVPLYLKKGAPHKSCLQKAWKSTEKEANHLANKAPKQFDLWQHIKQSKHPLTQSDLTGFKGANTLLKALVQKELIEEIEQHQFLDSVPIKINQLNEEQQNVVQDINKNFNSFAVHLIDGITGSGKTEVYFELMQQVIDLGQQVLFMLPEIGLTNAFIKRISQRFGHKIAVLHSARTAWKRYIAWDQAKRGAAQILVSTRSGVFVDFNNLGLIIVDEEHDMSYRQQDGVYYHGRDSALKRAQMLDIPVLMGSATPSLESLKNCQSELYYHHLLKRRALGGNLAEISVINTQNKPMQAGCSPALISAIKKHLADSGQIILFLNRRGFAPIVLCHSCGWRKQCEQCDSPMSLHLSVGRMICHHCSNQQPIPRVCGSCGDTDIQHYGVGTQQLEQTIQNLFPSTQVVRIDRDSTRLKESFEEKLKLLESDEAKIFIGTQMLAKGHDYAGITLVGIIDIDQGLFSTQYRALEQLAQTVIQVSGRAGRGAKKGQVILQTDFPEHQIMADLIRQDYRKISQQLLAERKLFNLPPYIKVIMFRAEAKTLSDAEAILNKIKLEIEQQTNHVSCVGPFASYLKKKEGVFRAQLYCHSQSLIQFRGAIRKVFPTLLKIKKPSHVKWRVDVDPLEL